MYTNYIFDLYGTLVDIDTNENSKSLWEKISLFYSFNGANYDYKTLRSAYRKKVNETKLSMTDTKYPDFPLEKIFLALFQDKNIQVSDDTVKNIGLDSLYINSNLSPKITRELKSKYAVIDGDLSKISQLIIK